MKEGKGIVSCPLVSIIITYYNHHVFIREAVLSALEQTYPYLEVIVVDDGSKTPAVPYLEDLKEVKCFWIENSGVSTARNYGFRQSKGEYLVFLDGDDRLLQGALAAQLQALEDCPDAGLVFGAVRRIDERGEVTRPLHICKPRSNYFLMLLESNPIECPAAALIARWAFLEAQQFNEDAPRNGGAEDYDLYLRITRNAATVRHTKGVVDYREHSFNMSSDKTRMSRSVAYALGNVETRLRTRAELRRLSYGRRRWDHVLNPKPTLSYKLRGLYYGFRALLGVSFLTALSEQFSVAARVTRTAKASSLQDSAGL